MNDFSDLTNDILDEIRDAGKYIRKAFIYKTKDQERANLYLRLSEEELGHMDALRSDLAREVRMWQEHPERFPSPDIKAKYDMLNEIVMSDVRRIKSEIRTFKEDE